MNLKINLFPYIVLNFSFLFLAFGLNAESNATKTSPDSIKSEKAEDTVENKYKTTKPEKKIFE